MTIHADELDNHQISQILVSRRQAFRLTGVGLGAAFAGLGASGCGDDSTASATTTPSVSASSCLKLTAEQIEGPYYLDYELVRTDIREGKQGVPLTLELTAVDAATCKPLQNAAIEVWHCDAVGLYSGYAASTADFRTSRPTGMPEGSPPPGVMPSGMPEGMSGGASHQEPVNELKFLRGMQPTDANGKVTFTTIVPGWYAGRAVHIHTKVHVGGAMSTSGYTGGHQAHTGQLYVDEKTIVEVGTLAPYTSNTVQRVLLDEDSIYPGSGTTGGLLAATYAKTGVTASITMAIDTVKTHDGSDAPAMNMGPTPTASNS